MLIKTGIYTDIAGYVILVAVVAVNYLARKREQGGSAVQAEA